jgi:peptidoglycan hydrolase-like protein with peptidoglycan-binding domain
VASGHCSSSALDRGSIVVIRVRRVAVALVAVLAAVAVGSALLPASAALNRPVVFPKKPRGLTAPVALPAAIDAATSYSPQVSCSPVMMPGVRMLRDLALSTYGRGSDGGVGRSCLAGGTSEHKEGRAWDWMLNVNRPAQRRVAGDFLAWLTKRGPDGRLGAQARRLGVMYVIYNRRMWRTYDPARGWTAYNGASPHTDHIHISFGWAGARGRTSFWTGEVAGPDYGPCAVFSGQPARISRRANPRPCRTPKALTRRSFRNSVQFGASGNRQVRFAQRRLGLAVTGNFGEATWAAVKAYQRAHDLPVTGVLDNPTWASLAPASVRFSVTEGFGPVRAARYGARSFATVRLQRGSAGRPVAFLQTALGLPLTDVNGWIGPRTAAAVRELKAAAGLTADAVVTAEVWEALAATT